MRASALLGLTLAGACVLLLTGCGSERADNTSNAYIAPASVNVRSELAQKNNTVAVLTHGERVELLEVKRRFVKIRTAKGVTGWVDATQLLTPAQMDAIQQAAKEALNLPAEGKATVFEPLNIHLEPSRQSPAFARIPEGGSVDVLAHKLEPKIEGPAKPPVFTIDRPQLTRREHKKKGADTVLILPPKPAPPKPPANWEELSAAHIDAAAPEPKKPLEPEKSAVMEDWTLVRTKDRQCGWVLSRNLIMSIPDEVAQYAEGKRITSYFDLGEVHDEEKGTKHNWLWTTLSEPAAYDFDGWRVFLWSRRHHRYETSYRQREVEGYFPVHVDPPDPNAFGRSFELIMKDDDDKMRRRTYFFDGTRVHLTAAEIYNPARRESESAGKIARDKSERPGWFRRAWDSLRSGKKAGS